MTGVPFKPRAYQLASELVAALGNEIKDAWRKGGIKALKDMPGIGQSIAEKIDEFFRTGKVRAYQEMKKKFPVDIWSLSKIEGLGPKHISDLYKYLKVKTLADLKKRSPLTKSEPFRTGEKRVKKNFSAVSVSWNALAAVGFWEMFCR